MNVKKYLIILVTFMMLFIGIGKAYAKMNDWGEDVPTDSYGAPTDEKNLSSYTSDKCKNNGSCFKGLGLRLKLIRYDKSESDEEQVVSTIYIINPNMLVDTVLTNGARLPGSEADFTKPGFDLTYLDPTPKETSDQKRGQSINSTKNLPRQGGEEYTCSNGSEGKAINNIYFKSKPRVTTSHTGQVINEFNGYGFSRDFTQCKSYYFHVLNSSEAAAWSELPYHWGYIYNTLKYMSKYEKVIYLARSPYLNMNGADDYIADTDITAENIANNYLDTKIMKRYAGSLDKVEKYFKVKLDSHDIGRYYIQVEGIYRVYLDKKDTPRSFLVKTIYTTPCEEGIGTKLEPVEAHTNYSPSSESDCKAAADMNGLSLSWVTASSLREAADAYCEGDSTCTNKDCCDYSPKGTWHYAVTAVPTSNVCSGNCNSSNFTCEAVKVPYWAPNDRACGDKTYHQIYGTQWYGYSELRYTMSDKDESCKTDKTSTSLADLMENNKHCNISDDDPTYSHQEQANQCANTGYKYYIGPDPDRALVGMTPNNKYNLYGSDGNKCRSGVKRYYVMDSTPDLCKDVCSPVGAKDSNAYLQCAENYCDHDVDYNLGGQPFVRKRDCILNSCGYTYGNVPTMGSKNGANRQAASSCANTKLFKTGSGTSFSLEKSAYNSTSSCGVSALGDISNGVGKDSVCIGDTVTDFNGTDADDTPFDQRTYINVACQETESITSVGGMDEPTEPGLPISYSINTKGQVTCVAFFNYEQWKVDYASIPSQDIIRRNRLDYIYNKFNNLMTNEYSVASNLTNFDAYGLDGKIMQHWTITDADGFGQVKWDNYKVDINNSSAYAESKETLKNGSTKNQEENPLTDATASRATLSVVPSEMDLTQGVYKAYTTGDKNSGGVINSDKKLIKVANNSVSTPGTGLNGNSELIGYVQTTTNTKSYVYAKYCVNKEGKVYEADSTGRCQDDKLGNNAFYTDFSDVNNIYGDVDIHNIKGTVTVESSLPSSNMEIYKNTDTCPIKIISEPPPPGRNLASCKFKIINGDSYGDKTFINGTDIEVMIEFYDDMGIRIKPDSFSITMTSPYRVEVSTNKYNKLSLKPNAYKSGLEDIHLSGKFTYSGYQTTTCEDDLTIIQKGNLCDIEKKENKDKQYNVNTNVANPKAVMGGMLNQRITQRILQDMYTADHLPSNLGRLGRPKVVGGLYKYLLDLTKAEFDDQTVIVGYVNNHAKGEFCLRPEGTPKQCVKNTTTGFGLYLPGQYAEITQYCRDNWAKDTYGFDSEYDCVDTCARCPTHESEVIGWEDSAEATRENLTKVNNFCDAYATYGYSSKDVCISLVYERCINPGEYKYRPVNSSNPFPSAVDNASIAPGYNVGDRIIGSNWKGKEHFITEGNPSVPRYQIALTADRIKQIRTEISGDNKTSVYTQLHPVNDLKEDDAYMSKYIRNTYYDMFCFIQGVRTTSTTGGCEISNN